jgi:hypothetical protein
LPSLKYWNPDLKIEVKRHPTAPSLLSLRFESSSQEALRNIASPSTKLTSQDSDPSTPADYFNTEAPRPSAADDQITPIDTPTDADPLYERTVTLALRRRPAWDIFRWLLLRVGPNYEKKVLTNEDKQLKAEHRTYVKEAEVIRARNKIVQAEADREKAAIEQARKAVDEAAKSQEAML